MHHSLEVTTYLKAAVKQSLNGSLNLLQLPEKHLNSNRHGWSVGNARAAAHLRSMFFSICEIKALGAILCGYLLSHATH